MYSPVRKHFQLTAVQNSPKDAIWRPSHAQLDSKKDFDQQKKFDSKEIFVQKRKKKERKLPFSIEFYSVTKLVSLNKLTFFNCLRTVRYIKKISSRHNDCSPGLRTARSRRYQRLDRDPKPMYNRF